jgi:hypothetical protein
MLMTASNVMRLVMWRDCLHWTLLSLAKVLLQRPLSRLVYIGLKVYVREQRRPNTANPEGLVRRRYIVGKEDQTSSDIKMQVSNR